LDQHLSDVCHAAISAGDKQAAIAILSEIDNEQLHDECVISLAKEIAARSQAEEIAELLQLTAGHAGSQGIYSIIIIKLIEAEAWQDLRATVLAANIPAIEVAAINLLANSGEFSVAMEIIDMPAATPAEVRLFELVSLIEHAARRQEADVVSELAARLASDDPAILAVVEACRAICLPFNGKDELSKTAAIQLARSCASENLAAVLTSVGCILCAKFEDSTELLDEAILMVADDQESHQSLAIIATLLCLAGESIRCLRLLQSIADADLRSSMMTDFVVYAATRREFDLAEAAVKLQNADNRLASVPIIARQLGAAGDRDSFEQVVLVVDEHARYSSYRAFLEAATSAGHIAVVNSILDTLPSMVDFIVGLRVRRHIVTCHLAASDWEAALAIAATARFKWERTELMQMIVWQLVPTSPDRALEVANAAVEIAREDNTGAERTAEALAWVAYAFTELDMNTARDLADEAEEIARSRVSVRATCVIRCVKEMGASGQATAAFEQLQTIPDPEMRLSALTYFAAAVRKRDPEYARTIAAGAALEADSLDEGDGLSPVKRRLAEALALCHLPTEAVRIARQVNIDWERREALLAVAEALWNVDNGAAQAAIRESMKPEQDGTGTPPWMYWRLAATQARLKQFTTCEETLSLAPQDRNSAIAWATLAIQRAEADPTAARVAADRAIDAFSDGRTFYEAGRLIVRALVLIGDGPGARTFVERFHMERSRLYGDESVAALGAAYVAAGNIVEAETILASMETEERSHRWEVAHRNTLIAAIVEKILESEPKTVPYPRLQQARIYSAQLLVGNDWHLALPATRYFSPESLPAILANLTG